MHHINNQNIIKISHIFLYAQLKDEFRKDKADSQICSAKIPLCRRESGALPEHLPGYHRLTYWAATKKE